MSDTKPEATTLKGTPRSSLGRQGFDRGFVLVCMAAATLSIVTLAVLLISIAVQGVGSLSWTFLMGSASREASLAGIFPSLIGTVLVCMVCALSAVPIGVGTAVLLEEYKPRNPTLRKLHDVVQLNITNLAGVPSIVYGLLGLTVFANMFGLFGNPLDPRFEIGVRYFDQYQTAGLRTVLVPVDAKNAPATAPGAGMKFVDTNLEPIDVKIVDAAEIAPLVAKLDEDIESLGTIVGEKIAAAPEVNEAVVKGFVADAWKQIGLTVPFNTFEQKLGAELIAAKDAKGRAAKKLIRNALKPVLEAEAAARFPSVLAADAAPSRIDRQRPWYFRIPIGRSILAGGLTLMLVVLPVIIISSQESLRSVPNSLRQASLAMGATQWQTIWKTTLPAAVPGIMTGVILSMSRAIGEAAPLLIIAGIVYITFTPKNLMDDFTAMPLQIYNWASRPQKEFHDIAAAGIILLLIILLIFNGVAVYIRQKTQRAN